MARTPRWTGSSAAAARLVLSRIDGSLDVADIAALTGIDEPIVEQAIAPLVAAGVVSFDASAPPVGPPSPTAPRTISTEMSAVRGLLPLSHEEQQQIRELYSKLNQIDHYRLLGVAATADTKTIKRAYFALAKLHHPDRYFRREVSSLRSKIDAIFAAINTALETLTDAERRATYDLYLREVLTTRMARRSAAVLEAHQDWKGAAETWARVVDSLPRDAHVQHRWAYALLRAGQDLDVALAAARRAIELDQSRAEYRVTAASLHLAQGNDRNALAELEVACRLEGDRAELLALRDGLARRLEGRR